MMRITAPWRPRAIPTTSGAPQRRPKSFLLQTNDEDDQHYILNREACPQPQIPRESELFQISDLLLDLDAYESKFVRPFTDEDAEVLEKKWAADASRMKIKARIREMQWNLEYSRQKANDIVRKPMNPWRVTDHDVLSVALRGAPEPAPRIDSEEIPRDDLTAREALDPRKDPSLLHTICSENGVSSYALEKEQLLLHWLKSRQNIVQTNSRHVHVGQSQPTWDMFFASLGKQGSIASIRRLVSQSFCSGPGATLLRAEPRSNSREPHALLNKMSKRIRTACTKVLDQLHPKDPSYFETLTFLGSLRQRLSSHEENIGGPLCGLGLQISADLANPEATFSYLGLGFRHKLWAEHQRWVDVSYTLQAYLRHLTSADSAGLDASDQVILLSMLTGVGEEEEASVESFRTLVLFAMHTGEARQRREAGELYSTYLMVLGRLGAVATLWKEWHLVSSVEETQEWTLQKQRGFQPERDFAAAIGAALSVVARREYAVPTDLGLVACATLDMESIEMQDDDGVVNQSGAGPIERLEDSTVVAALELPLDGWLEEVQAAAARPATWSPKSDGG
ncbi:hypothetical protein B0T10DRAFT_488672 [Thelonectria olida]|uniref:Uncharacterized protein n=1 Tax=Thelonectria olida TaxID=1576542 RepID=A0A9P8W3T4_9HYPO|nr:hypothetical protein B0T10DRAFT_488672 [Thelonectria olida]